MSHSSTLPSIGQLFSSTWKEYKNRFLVFFMISFVANVLSLVFQFVPEDSSQPWVWAAAAVLFLAMLYIALWGQGALTLAVRSSEKNDWTTFFTRSHNKILTLLWSGILTFLAVLGGTVLLIVPGIIFGIWFSFASFFIMYEDKKAIDSMKASKALVTGNVFGILVRWLVPGVIALVISVIVSLLTVNSMMASAIASFIFSVLLTPFFTLYGYYIYEGLKRRTA